MLERIAGGYAPWCMCADWPGFEALTSIGEPISTKMEEQPLQCKDSELLRIEY